MFRKIVACALVITLASSVLSQDSELKTTWKEVTAEYGEWGYGYKHERRGQICDTYRQFGQESIHPDVWPGCTVLFVADPDDTYDLGTVAAGEQDNFLNTQHYKQAWNLHGKGFLGTSLPRAPKDLDPVCLVAYVEGRLVLGYEEGEGDKLLPCPGHDEGVPFTEEMIREGLNGTRDLEDMCTQCYQAVCTGDRSVRARDCGSSSDGGVDLEDEAIFYKQADPVYHCHMTMADEGACDYVQYVQHESSRTYYMDYSVMCGWENIQYLNITFCDCTKVAGTNNGCRRYEAQEMAYVGVVCGNCNGVGFNEDRAFESIFSPLNDNDQFDGQCAKYKTSEEGWGKNYSKMMCSKGIWCPSGYTDGDNCKFHCDNFGINNEYGNYYDEGCGDYPDFPVEICTDDKCFYTPKDKKGTWAVATEECEALGGSLASILSEEEEAIVQRLSRNSGQNSLWIGLDDRQTEGTYTWSDESAFEFEKYRSGQPNDDNNPAQDCTRWFDDGWQDKPCEEGDFAFVCSSSTSFSAINGAGRRLLAVTPFEEVTMATRFDWGNVVADVKASGYAGGKKQRRL
mmetsp:Transcript_44257/g.90329  ORF Transcript_44257/g.90329 Transcript_44257/m.90329 type:complete len:568 (+) Transcript_44257:78-1781(+)|eukprot:CAMPEP_0181327060 /NCGR_PEP_ID=MMETSP1101-20121128/21874_1 /TAXON_ID=46948 /ORGANISM="Rhodomonas abbreviata, Strain Caron Lab Isolate" /LENGTH=567 /DNA_ID=CAMNT_0023435643 /DNA_START=70 /DNA_END=1773 /DNA_ORIENTATION=+